MPEQMLTNERKLGPTTLRTYRSEASIYRLHPNQSQPRPDWDAPDEQLQRQIVSNRGLWEPILVERLAGEDGDFAIIDGHRRWQSCKTLVEVNKQTEFEVVPIEVIDRPLGPVERMMVWIYIHRQRREWDILVKEGVAYQLVTMVGKPAAADMLGLSLNEVDRLCEIYEFAKERFANLPVAESGLTWAREILNLSARLRTPEVVEMIVRKVNEGLITNSKDIRHLRRILKDKEASRELMSSDGTIGSALDKLRPPDSQQQAGLSISRDLDALVSVLQQYSWAALAKMRESPDFLRKLDHAEQVIQAMKRMLRQPVEDEGQ